MTVLPMLSAEINDDILLQSARPGPIETKPSRTITLAFQVINHSLESHEFNPATGLPDGWKRITPDSSFVLNPGKSTVCLVSFLVPLKTLAGRYSIKYSIQAADDPSLGGSLSVEIRVLLEANLEIQLLQAPQIVFAGEELKASFVVSNRSNAPSSVSLQVMSTEGYSCQLEVDEIRLDTGESETLAVIIKTDPRLRQKIQHNLHFSASAKDLGEVDIRATASARTEIIPLISGEGDLYQRFPAGMKFIGFASKNTGSVSQFELSGLGEIPNIGISKVDFLFRGPGRPELMTFGLFREEYRLSLETNKASFNLGDHIFFLTKLSEYGRYGRGAEGMLDLGKFSIKSYTQQSLFFESRTKQKAMRLNYEVTKNLEFSLSYLSTRQEELPADDLFSVQTQFVSEPFNLNVEYAQGAKGARSSKIPDSAYWIEMFGNLKSLFTYRFNRIRSDPGYPGSYSDMVFNSARLSFSPLDKLTVRVSYSDYKQNIHRDPSLAANQEKYALFGLQYRLKNWAIVSLDYKQQTRTALFPDPLFDYTDRSLRLGINPHLGTINLQGLVDIGETSNTLSGETRRLVDLNASGSLTLFGMLSLGGYFQWRNQESDFTGDYERTMNINFNLKLYLGKTDVYAIYRKSMYYDFFERILFDLELVEQLLYNHLDVFEVIIRQRLFNTHSISFRLRHASSASDSPGAKEEFIGLVEYAIPLGVPVGRNPETGQLSGSVYDVQNGQSGIAGVIIKLDQRATVTNEEGRFVFYGLKAGPSLLSIEQRTLGPNRITALETPAQINIEGGRKTEFDVAVVRSGKISGQVMVYQFADKKENIYTEKHGLANSLIELRGQQTTYNQITDEHGFFRFDELRQGKWTLRVIDQVSQNFYVEKETFEFDITSGGEEKVLIKVLPLVRQIRFLEEGTLSLVPEEKKEPLKVLPEYMETTEITPAEATASDYTVQVASCLFQKSAAAIEKRLRKDFETIYTTISKKEQETYYVVRIRATDSDEAEKAFQKLIDRGYKPLILKKKALFTPDEKRVKREASPNRGEKFNGNGNGNGKTHFETNGSENGGSSESSSAYSVQVASCLYKKSAETVKNKLDDRYAHVFISVVENTTGTYHVVKIPASDLAAAKKIVKELIGLGYDPIIKYE
jgi:hypothetical protein